MTYLIDSDVIISWLAGRTSARETLDPLMEVGVAMSVISLMEVVEGLDPRERDSTFELDKILGVVTLHPVGEQTALIASVIRREIRSRKIPVRERALDILIAATAIEHDLVLVTRNIRHFRDIEGIRLWPAESH